MRPDCRRERAPAPSRCRGVYYRCTAECLEIVQSATPKQTRVLPAARPVCFRVRRLSSRRSPRRSRRPTGGTARTTCRACSARRRCRCTSRWWPGRCRTGSSSCRTGSCRTRCSRRRAPHRAGRAAVRIPAERLHLKALYPQFQLLHGRAQRGEGWETRRGRRGWTRLHESPPLSGSRHVVADCKSDEDRRAACV